MRKPKCVPAGGHVRALSPASPLSPEECEQGAAELRRRGYEVSYGRHAFDHFGYLAGNDEDRASDLMEAFEDPSVDAVLCIRGGFGSARLIEHLDLDRIARSGKWFGGYSDVTTLHFALNQRGLSTFYSPMLWSLSTERPTWAFESFFRALAGQDPFAVDYPRAKTMNPGKSKGLTTGGCLCLVTDSLGTPVQVSAEGKIVIIEDVDEIPHRIDAMLTSLLLSGVAQKAAGFVIGEMTRTDEHSSKYDGRWPWREIVRDRLGPLGVPIVTDFPFGHVKGLLTIPLGVEATLDADAGTLTLNEPPCSENNSPSS